MASHEEARADDTRGLPGASASNGTTDDQEETDRQEDADEQATRQPAAAAAERNGEPAAASSEPSPDGAVVSPARPRGVASFPGGPPPTVTPVPDLPDLPVPETAPAEDGPRFRVTTVETTAAATRPAGPPPPTPRRAPAPLAPEPEPEPEPVASAAAEAQEETAGEAAAEVTVVAGPPVEVEAQPELEVEPAPEAPAGIGTEAPVETAPDAEETAPDAEVAAPSPEVAAAEAPTAVPAAADAPAEATAAARPASRRRRRGRSSRSSRSAEPAQATATPEAAAEPALTPAAPAAATAAPAAPADEALPAGTMHREPTDEDESDEDDLDPSGAGSARTRARRRRRAAAKARLRGGNQAGPASTEAATAPPGGRSRVSSAAAPEETPAARAGGGAGAPAAKAAQPPAAPVEAAPPSSPRGRRRQRGAAAPAAAAPATAAPATAAPATAAPMAAATAETEPEQPSPTRTRGRGRRRLPGTRVPADTGAHAAVAATAEPAPPRAAPAERSTRLEAARGRGAGGGVGQGDRSRRRRTRGLTEDQKRYLREGLERRMLVTEGAERTQIGVLEGRTLVEHYVTRKAGRSLVGNIYAGRVQNVLPGMEAAFVDIGRGRNAVLYAGEVNYSEEDLDGEAPRIEKALKPGQSILVQVTKDPIGAKGARLTTQVSLAGRYLVLQPEDSTFGISRRLPEEERVRLREILKEVRPKGLGLIVRTAAEGAGADDLRADLARLQARWEAIERKARKASPPAVIYQEPELVVRVIRDIFSPDFVELVVDAPGLYERVRAYLEEVAPDLLPKMHSHDGRLPLFEQHRVSEQIHKALERKVWLPSGGSLVIDQTEAMTVVDVNTGKYVGKSNLEETVVATNLEAAEEIVRQLRLRDIGGIIIIDFIDMLFERNQQAVVERLRAALAKDKTKSQVMEVSSLGLVQMTRKRVSGGLLDSFSETCPTCEGRGVVITHEI